jgi:hypothetical protein
LEQRDDWGFEVQKHFQIQTQLLESVWEKIIGIDKMIGIGGISSRVIRLTGAIFMLLSLCIFFKLIQQPTKALNKTQFMPNINLLHV